MNSATKTISLQAYRLLVYKRALHPELFPIKNRTTIAYGDYQFEGWIMPGAHLMRFVHEDACATELITADESTFPERGLVIELPCAGERDHEESFGDHLKYVSTVQTEQLPESLYRDTYNELTEFAEETSAITHAWQDEDGGRCASILDVQRFRREVHAQTYHLIAQGGIVLRTQAIFEHTTP